MLEPGTRRAPRATKPAAMRPRHFVRSMLRPAKPSSAGSRVIDASTVKSDRERGGDAEPADEPDAHEEHAEQRDDDGGAGEHHRPAGGVHRDADRLADVVAGVQLLAVAGDDEQRVVDADAEADHHADERREVGDLHEVADEDHERPAQADAERARRRPAGPSPAPSRTPRSG